MGVGPHSFICFQQSAFFTDCWGCVSIHVLSSSFCVMSRANQHLFISLPDYKIWPARAWLKHQQRRHSSQGGKGCFLASMQTNFSGSNPKKFSVWILWLVQKYVREPELAPIHIAVKLLLLINTVQHLSFLLNGQTIWPVLWHWIDGVSHTLSYTLQSVFLSLELKSIVHVPKSCLSSWNSIYTSSFQHNYSQFSVHVNCEISQLCEILYEI